MLERMRNQPKRHYRIAIARPSAMKTCLAVLYVLLGLCAAAGFCGARAQAPAPSITVTSPLDYQVFQRRTLHSGSILVRGSAPAARHVEARVVGAPSPERWLPLALDHETGQFSGSLPTTAGGFYQVLIRAIDRSGASHLTTVEHVGVGEVFVIAGQSNSTNYGETPQRTTTGMVTTFDGAAWSIANDPQPGTQDGSRKGSFAPPFGDELYRRYHVPIGIASIGHGSTSVRQWLPAGDPVHIMPTMTKYIVKRADGTLVSDGTLFNGMMTRIHQLGARGFRALLWHQGESDAHQPAGHEIAASTYRNMMQRVIKASRTQGGWHIPWIVAETTYHTPDDPACPPIRAAQRSLWESDLALEGPDTDTLTAAYRQNGGTGTHFNDAGLKAHGLLWAEKVSHYIDAGLIR